MSSKRKYNVLFPLELNDTYINNKEAIGIKLCETFFLDFAFKMISNYQNLKVCLWYDFLIVFRYNDILLKRIFMSGGVVYSPARQSFVSRTKAGFPRVEDYTDVSGEEITTNFGLILLKMLNLSTEEKDLSFQVHRALEGL